MGSVEGILQASSLATGIAVNKNTSVRKTLGTRCMATPPWIASDAIAGTQGGGRR